MIEDWMERQSIHSSVLFNSTSSSSESSFGAGFSSSETESFYKHKPKPKLQSSKKQTKLENRNSDKHPKSKSEGSSAKLKLQGLKMYGELKKAKQPISPGGRIASFLKPNDDSNHSKNFENSFCKEGYNYI